MILWILSLGLTVGACVFQGFGGVGLRAGLVA